MFVKIILHDRPEFNPVFLLHAAILHRGGGLKMKKETLFTGAGVALVTPFSGGEVDYDCLANLIEYQISNGTDAIITVGTTGEGSTLSDEEHRAVMKFTVEKVAGRVPVIAGTGSNDNAYAISLSKYACEVGVDGLLLVTPYYNKTSQRGLVKAFVEVADAVDKPIVLYNVPSRTGMNISISAYKELAKHENIAAVKEANGDISSVAQLIHECGDMLDVYSGNDDQIVPILSLGGKGVISVLSNVAPKETHDIVSLFLEGKTKESAALQLKYLDLINALFAETNPIPVKAAVAMMGLCSDEIRSPLCAPEESTLCRLESEMKKLGIIGK